MNVAFPSGKQIGLWLGPLAFVLIYFMAPIEGMRPEGQAVLAITAWVAIWWVSECVPIPVSSLLPIILLPLTGAISASEVTSAYGDNAVFLYLGGFLLAIAMENWNLHRRIALLIISKAGSNPRKLVLGFMLATALLSMWISNTATVLMMLPISLGIVQQFNSLVNIQQDRSENIFGKVLLLSLAYSASIGGLATIIGSPTNAIFVGLAQRMYNYQVSFLDWMALGLPIVIVLLLLSWLYLTRIAFKLPKQRIEGLKDQIHDELEKLGKLSFEEKRVLLVFALTALAWLSRSYLLNPWWPSLNDTMIALIGASALFIIPAQKSGTKILQWQATERLPWGILLLFGGGLAIAAGFQQSGLALWIGQQMMSLNAIGFFWMILIVALVVNFLTEITSNVATATMILPVLGSLAEAVGVHPFALMIAATMASSCAFMLPVATPPNAVVFGAGYLKMGDMVRVGFALNLISTLIIVLMLLSLLPITWGAVLKEFPDIF